MLRGALTGFPRTMLLLKFRATASHNPFNTSSVEYPFCWAWIMSDFANTEQRPAIRAAHFACDDNIADLFHAILQPRGLLIEKRSRSRSTFPAGGIVGNSGGIGIAVRTCGLLAVAARQPQVLGTLSTNFKYRSHLRINVTDGAGDGLKLIFSFRTARLRDQPPSRPGHAKPAIFGRDGKQASSSSRRSLAV